jgi:hypothetical protein
VIGFLDIHGARQFLGNKSLSWLRLHVSEIPHYRLHDRLLFDPQELRAYVLTAAERHNPIDVDKLVHEVMQQPKRKGRGAG